MAEEKTLYCKLPDGGIAKRTTANNYNYVLAATGYYASARKLWHAFAWSETYEGAKKRIPEVRRKWWRDADVKIVPVLHSDSAIR